MGTVTAQLLYEIAGHHYPNADVVARFDTVSLDQEATDRVRISGARGLPAPPELKVCINLLGGWRNSMTFILTGLDIEEKADLTLSSLNQALGGISQFAEFDARLIRSDKPDAPVNVEATAQLRITVKDPDPARVGRSFSGAATELALAGYPGLHLSSPPAEGSVYGVYWPALVPADLVLPEVVHPDGHKVPVPNTANQIGARGTVATGRAGPVTDSASDASLAPEARLVSTIPVVPDPAGLSTAVTGRTGTTPTRRLPLGVLIGARSGDKGGNANVGLWARSDEAWLWLDGFMTIDTFRTLLPEADRSRSTDSPFPRCAPSISWWWGCSARAWPVPPDPIHRPRDWASTFGAGWSTFRRLSCRPTCWSEQPNPPEPPNPPSKVRSNAMDFIESDEMQMLREAVSSIASKFGHEYYVAKAHADERTDELWRAVAEAGFIGVNVPEEYGGGGGGITELAAVQEELAAAGCPLLVIVVSAAICVTIIAKFGTEEQKQRWLPGFATGELKMAFAITEPDAGSNSHNLSLTASKDGDIYRLNGSKYYISGVDECQAILVVTRSGVDPDTGRGQLSLFVVDTDAPGLDKQVLPVEITAPEKQYTLFFDNVEVEADRLIGAEGEGLRQVFFGLNPERILSAATANGIGRYALGKAADYAISREVWGTPIGRHQGISHPLAKCKIEVELARLMTDKAAWLCDFAGDTPEAGEAANMAKYSAAEAALAALDQAIQTHGGNGMSSEYGLADLWGMTRLLRIAPVSREMILNFVAQHSLGLPKSY